MSLLVDDRGAAWVAERRPFTRTTRSRSPKCHVASEVEERDSRLVLQARRLGKNSAPADPPTGPIAWGPPAPRRIYPASAAFFELTQPSREQSDDSITSFPGLALPSSPFVLDGRRMAIARLCTDQTARRDAGDAERVPVCEAARVNGRLGRPARAAAASPVARVFRGEHEWGCRPFTRVATRVNPSGPAPRPFVR